MNIKDAFSLVLENTVHKIPEKDWSEELGQAFDAVTDHAIKNGLIDKPEGWE